MHNGAYNKFDMGDLSWIEARAFNTLALEALPPTHPLGIDIRSRLKRLVPSYPTMNGLRPAATLSQLIECGGSAMAFNAFGAIKTLRMGTKGSSWASDADTLMGLHYVTYSQKETWDARINMTCVQPGCANPEDKVWRTRLISLWHNGTKSAGGDDKINECRAVAEMAFEDEAQSKYGAPRRVFVEYFLGASSLRAKLTWWNKSTTRLPESLMIDFTSPRRPGYGVTDPGGLTCQNCVLSNNVTTKIVCMHMKTHPTLVLVLALTLSLHIFQVYVGFILNNRQVSIGWLTLTTTH